MKTRTKMVKTTLATLLVCFAGLAVTTPASAAPVGIDAARLSPQLRTELRASIDKARVSDPAAFKDVRAIVANAREANKRARGRKAPVALHLAGLGSKALLPMLELVAFDTTPLAPNETAAERASVQRDLVEAVGLLKDARAMPVLVAALAKEGDFAMTRTAAEAVARLDSDEAARTLVASLGKASGERATAILAGMGACHRAVVSRTLADRLAARPDDATAKHVVKSLGHVGNAWAWKTLSERGDEAAARETAARALVTAFVQYTGEVREAAAKALLVVDDAHTTGLIETARRGASADVAVAIDDLARRVASNPTR
jgi:RNase P/RNase MRP subunit POP5